MENKLNGKAKLSILFLLYSFLSFAQLQEESLKTVFKMEQRPLLVQPGQTIEHTVAFDAGDEPVRRFLRVIGGVQMPGKFAPRGEEFFRQAEYLLDDCLDSLNTFRDKHSLYFKGENELFERHVYNRISGIAFEEGQLLMETVFRRNQLKVNTGGDFGVELQIYYQKERRHPDDVYDSPDTVMYMPVPQGSGKFKLQKTVFNLPHNVACILLRAGGTGFSGECWMEAPRLYQNDRPVFEMPFVQNSRRQNDYNYWVGVNMSTRSWPRWKLEFKDRLIFEGNIFDRASCIADFYIPLPSGLSGAGALKLTLMKENHRTAFPYEVREIQILEETARDFEIVAVPRFVVQGDTAGILLEINKPDITLNFTTDAAVAPEHNTFIFKQTGLHAVPFKALELAVNVGVSVACGNDIRYASIGQIVIKERDEVYLSVGDDIYIDKEVIPYNYYFKWYIRERAGNFFQFRPSYQWSGVRITDDNIMKQYLHLLNQLRMPYAWQVEGRTLAATRINLSLTSLQSPMFRGKQAHENDGGYYYWNHFLYTGLHSDMAARTRPYGGIFAKHRPIYTDHGIFIHYDPYGVKDMADGANKLVANLSYSRGESVRHTGPSGIYRYLYQAGYDWLGAELMYMTDNIYLSALRGASRAYGKNNYGSLHAMQWGSQPFTDPKHSLRFYLSLAVAYMHGSSHINTEDGLWTDEYANDHYTLAGKRHMEVQHKMMDYIETHSRKGYLNTPIAVIQGRNDAWNGWRPLVWAQKADKWAPGKATESLNLMQVFYPENTVGLYGKDGWFTSAPYGAVDILPIEAANSVMNRYKALIFLGWNSFDNADFIRIMKFVEQGGIVMFTAAHLNSELQPDAPIRFPDDDTVIKMLLGEDYRSYETKKIIRLGKGAVIYYPQFCYPADELIRQDYTESMHEVALQATTPEYEKGWIKSSPFIDFTAWDIPLMRTLYVLNIDWRNEQDSLPCTLLLGDRQFDFDVERYAINTIRCACDLAVMPEGNTSDILDIRQEKDSCTITCQTTGKDTIHIFDSRTGKQEIRELQSAGIHTIVWNYPSIRWE